MSPCADDVRAGASHLADLFRALFPRGCKDRVIVMLRAYFGRSELHSPARIVTVAGGVGHAKEWLALERDWRYVLDTEGLESFHMTDFETRNPPFKNEMLWPNARRRRLIKRLIGVMGKRILYAVAASVQLDDYDQLSDADKRTLGSPYAVCATKAAVMTVVAFEEITKEMERLRGRPVNRMPIALVFEAGDRGVGDLVEQLQEINRDNHGQWWSSWSFERDANIAALQSADILAYEAGKHVVRALGSDRRPMRKSFNMMLQGVTTHGQLFQRGRLAEMAAQIRGDDGGAASEAVS